MPPPKLESKCAICLGVGDGFHFGAEACKACTAFFRRCIQLKKTFQCRGNGNCDVTMGEFLKRFFFFKIDILFV
ncbi:hypothetical protein B9Z55_017631 [Caenorhabditis nigoni]|uniref:Nuclear receptor domain-containing protein n=1 Tax=Caenorhabditis nigoni TaxID=1611254 RepID=A0A2G5TAA7_9PELO|nr:hypothetical protein B9Z55_017631 [Caenorhabditis nigoni]